MLTPALDVWVAVGERIMIMHDLYAADLRWSWMLSFPLKNGVLSNEED